MGEDFETVARLPTRLWVSAHLSRCNAEGVPAVLARRGDPTGGLVLLKLNRLAAGCRVLTQTRDLEGRLAWWPAFEGRSVPEEEAEVYIERQVKRDPDLWVVEIEHPEGWHPFEGKEL